jgi:tetratricopeptide (TPR) repeat protein
MAEKSSKVCFVVMGFGKKTDFETQRVLDLDKSYQNMIKPAVEDAGLTCIRADEIVHSGLIDVPMYEQLLKADVVVADLSTSNKNAFYELGVRHALRPFTTVVIAEDGIKTFPFDINHVVVRKYHHLGEDIGYDEVMRFRKELTGAIRMILEKTPPDPDSPVYTFLNGLTPPELAAAAQAGVQAAGTKAEPHRVLMQRVDEAQKKKDWATAKTLLTAIRSLMGKQDDPYILQRLALATYKSKIPDEAKALREAQSILEILEPATSHDPETLGLWGAVNKRLWDKTRDSAFLNRAISAYKRGYYLRNDYYNGINYAFLLNSRADLSADAAEAIADFVLARRVRTEVLSICERWLEKCPMPDEQEIKTEYLRNWYWVMVTIGEAYIGLGNEDAAKEILEKAFAVAPEDWMPDSTNDQLERLRLLLQNDPRKWIAADVKAG